MYRREGGGFGGPRRSFAPVKVGEELDVTIDAIGEKGDGIAKKDGFVLFVPGVKKDQKVRIRVTKVLRKVGFAEVVGGTPGEKSEEAPEEASEEPAEEQTEETAEEQTEETEEVGQDSESFGEESSEEQ